MNIKLVKNYNQIRPDRATLFCFPFAGGGASAYNSWVQKMKDKVTVCPIQLPGREERIMEKPYNNMTDMLDELEETIWKCIRGPYAFWGHSMGGKIAYELEKRLEKRGKTAQCFLVSGSRIPSIPERNPIYHLPDDEFKKALGRFEGTPKEILENQELLDFFLPMLRADFTMDETYHDKKLTVLQSPIPGHNETDIERLKDINVTACVESIINQIGETDEKLTLVFHSMAGIFIYDTYKKIGKEQIESIYCVACCIPAAGETMSDILKGPLHSFASFCAGKIQVVKRFPKILALAIFGNGMNKKQREKLYSSLCGESTNLLFERINECKLETSIKWILPTKDRALNPKQQRVYMNNIGNIKSIIKLTAPHDVMISHPEEVAKILLEN